MKRIICMILICMMLITSITSPVYAAEADYYGPPRISIDNNISPLATGSFNMTIPANTKAVANSSFRLAAGETVTIKASYSPFSASVDFGLIAPDGKFYYFNVTDGSIDKSIQVSDSGEYTLQIRNNSENAVQVMGFVNY